MKETHLQIRDKVEVLLKEGCSEEEISNRLKIPRSNRFVKNSVGWYKFCIGNRRSGRASAEKHKEEFSKRMKRTREKYPDIFKKAGSMGGKAAHRKHPKLASRAGKASYEKYWSKHPEEAAARMKKTIKKMKEEGRYEEHQRHAAIKGGKKGGPATIKKLREEGRLKEVQRKGGLASPTSFNKIPREKLLEMCKKGGKIAGAISGPKLAKWLKEHPEMHAIAGRKGGLISGERLGQWVKEHSKELQPHRMKAFKKMMSGKPTSIELKMKKELLDRGIDFEMQYNFKDMYLIDFAIPSKKIMIECDGDYWHLNPNHYTIFEDSTYLSLKSGKIEKLSETLLKNMVLDNKKNTYFKRRKEWVFMRFWESEINENVSTCVDKIEKVISGK